MNAGVSRDKSTSLSAVVDLYSHGAQVRLTLSRRSQLALGELELDQQRLDLHLAARHLRLHRAAHLQQRAFGEALEDRRQLRVDIDRCGHSSRLSGE